MNKKMTLAAVSLISVITAWILSAPLVSLQAEKSFNKTLQAPVRVSPAAEKLHASLRVADLHADSLLFGRDLSKQSAVGHTDFPRLQRGGVRLQLFGVVTKVPKGMNIKSNRGDSDAMRTLTIAAAWPPSTIFSLRARAIYQGERLVAMSDSSPATVKVVRSRKDLDQALSQPGTIAALLALEGAHALEGKMENLDRLKRTGFTVIGLAHFFDNEFSGSAHGISKGGLTEAGRSLVRKIEAEGMIVDLAHSSPQAMEEVLKLSSKPVIVSHTGVRGTCDNQRNLTDAQLRSIARNGGLVGIGFWKTAVCGTSAEAIARAIRHAVDVAGIDHVALGSDFDGAVTVPFDAAKLSAVTDALLRSGFSDAEIRKIMGENAIAFFQRALPD